MSRIWSVIRAMIRPPPSRPSEIAVVRIIAMVMVMFRRNPVRTSVTTNPARMGSSRLPRCGGLPGGRVDVPVRRALAAHAVPAARLVPHDLAQLQFDHPPAHRTAAGQGRAG